MSASAIPILPSSIAGAVPYNIAQTSKPLKVWTLPAEGMKCVPMQFTFASNTVYQVNTNTGSAAGLSQIATLFVDTTNSSHDINILFPDTGHQMRINFGETSYVPILTGTALPPFYVILDSGGATSATDVVNIIAINQFIPPSNQESFKRVVAYGYGEYFSLVPTFTQSTIFSLAFSQDQILNTTVNLIACAKWYITGWNIIMKYADMSINSFVDIILTDAGNGLSIANFAYDSQAAVVQKTWNVSQMTGINYVSNGGGNMTAVVGMGGAIAGANFIFNIYGGVLVN